MAILKAEEGQHKNLILENIQDLIDLYEPTDGDRYGRIRRGSNNIVFTGIQNGEKENLSSRLRQKRQTQRPFNPKDETECLGDFQMYGQLHEPRLKDLKEEEDIWEIMAIAQHYRVPTRLLDWSWSPLVALHFATSRVKIDDEEGNPAVVWAINIDDVNELLPEDFHHLVNRHRLKIFTYDDLKAASPSLKTIHDYESNAEDSFIFLQPSCSDQRIFTQASVFSIMRNAFDPLDEFLQNQRSDVIRSWKFTIPWEKVKEIRDQLDMMFINERTMYPGLPGLGDLMSRRYFCD